MRLHFLPAVVILTACCAANGAEPDRWAAGVFSDYSRPGAESIGFVPIARFTLWSRAPRNHPVL